MHEFEPETRQGRGDVTRRPDPIVVESVQSYNPDHRHPCRRAILNISLSSPTMCIVKWEGEEDAEGWLFTTLRRACEITWFDPPIVSQVASQGRVAEKAIIWADMLYGSRLRRPLGNPLLFGDVQEMQGMRCAYD